MSRVRIPVWYVALPIATLGLGFLLAPVRSGPETSMAATVIALQTQVARPASPVEVTRVVTQVVENPVDRVVTQVVEKSVDRIVTQIVEKSVDRVVTQIVEKPVDRVITATPGPPTAGQPIAAAGPKPSADSFAPRGVTQTVAGNIANSNQADRHKVQAKQDQILEVRVKRTSGVSLRPSIVLVDPTGQSEADASPNGSEAFLIRRLASSGEYTIVVRAYEGLGPYSATWWIDRMGGLGNGGEVSAAITDNGQMDRYLFNGRQGQRLEARVKRTSGISLRPFIQLIDPTGQREADASPSGSEAFLERQLASSGTYTLVISAYEGQGPYSVTLAIR